MRVAFGNEDQFANFCFCIFQNKHADYRTAPASVQNFFAKLAGEDMELDAEKLQQVLNHALKKGKIFFALF